MRKIVIVCCALILIIGVFAGCSDKANNNGNTESANTKNSAPEPTPKETPKEEPAAEKPPEPVILKLFHGKQEAQETFTEIIKKFNEKYPHITIEQEVVTNDPSTVLKSRIATDAIPDIFSAGIEVLDIAKGGYLVDLSSEPFLGNLVESSVKSRSFTDNDGKTWAMPVDGSSIGVFYNKQIFADNGLTIPTTITEMNHVIEVLKAKDIPAFALAFKDAWTIKMTIISALSPAVYGKDLKWDDKKNAGEAAFETSEGWKSSFQALRMIYEGGNTKTAFDTDYNGAVGMFALGEAAMMAQGLWALEPIRAISPDLNIGMMAMPVSEDPNDAKLHVFPDFSLSLSSKSKHIDESKLFLEFLTTSEISTIWSNKARLFSAVKGVSTPFDPVAADVEKLLAEGRTISQADRGWPTPFHPEFEKTLPEFLFGKKDLAESLKYLDQAWMDALKNSQ